MSMVTSFESVTRLACAGIAAAKRMQSTAVRGIMDAPPHRRRVRRFEKPYPNGVGISAGGEPRGNIARLPASTFIGYEMAKAIDRRHGPARIASLLQQH